MVTYDYYNKETYTSSVQLCFQNSLLRQDNFKKMAFSPGQRLNHQVRRVSWLDSESDEQNRSLECAYPTAKLVNIVKVMKGLVF
jgi:hypothetical protein